MATRSLVGMKTTTGIRYIYVHWDGYPEYQRPILKQSFNTEETITKLLDLGDCRQLDHSIEGVDTYRERGEKGKDAKEVTGEIDLDKAAVRCDADFVYLFDGKDWLFRETSNLAFAAL